ncbi:ATPase component of ABC transporter with duplicated ATPase domains [Acinetobacter baumannii]|nr:ATPase component of ABC transporter with duplicated ATPase domains [Acinetobacter baumannii]
MTQQVCVISQLTLEFPSKVMFKELNFSLEHHQVSALIGRNGQGKSLLMQLLHKISPTTEMHISGQINWQTKHAYLSQLTRLQSDTIAEALEVNHLYNAFQRVEQGEAEYDDYDLLEGHWDLPNIWEALLRSAQLPTDLDFPVKQLSEGQKNQVSLIRIIFKN